MGGKGSGRKPRDYPIEVVKQVVDLYESGMTVAEIRSVAPKGYRVQTILARYLPERRRAIKRDQQGEQNDFWKGDAATYSALHLRVAAKRGKPQLCSRCHATEPGRYEWANLTGNYHDINDYERMCVSCHRQFDSARRRATGMRTSPLRR